MKNLLLLLCGVSLVFVGCQVDNRTTEQKKDRDQTTNPNQVPDRTRQ